MSAVQAVVVPATGPALAAVRGQLPPGAANPVVAGAWAEGIAQARGAEWLWLVAGDTEPQPGALDALLAAGAPTDGLRAPVLLTSRVAAPDGSLDPSAAPWPPLHDRRGAMDAAERRLALVRLARWGSLLVRADAIARHGGPRADLGGVADLEWTARLLREEAGYLVPASAAVRRTPRRAGLRDLPAVVRALASERAWAPQERLWFLYATLLEGSRPRRLSPRG